MSFNRTEDSEIDNGPIIHFNGTGEDALRQMAIVEAEERQRREALIANAADQYAISNGFEHSGGIIEAAFEAGARWAMNQPRKAGA